jgi:hypothetical protein
MNASNRVAIYGRVSSCDGRQEVENQLDELRRFAATQRWEIVIEYVDHESGGHADRPEFRRMLADSAQRRFDVLLFWALDRLTREGARETLQYLNQLSDYGVAFRSFREPYLDSCGMFKDAVIAILGAIAKQERARISVPRLSVACTRRVFPLGLRWQLHSNFHAVVPSLRPSDCFHWKLCSFKVTWVPWAVRARERS